MLTELHIRGLAIIDEVSIEFGPGLTTITGETGAGKSLLIGALRLLLGERASSDLVAVGQSRARIQGVFSLETGNIAAQLREMGIIDENDALQLIIRRELLAAGGSRHYLNDVAVPLAHLQDIGRSLVAIHGQNDQALLLQPARQLELLDAFGRCEGVLAEYERCYREAKEAAQRLESLVADAADLEKQRSFLRFQVEEIDRAQLRPDEDKELETELVRLRHAQRIYEALQQAVDLAYEGERNPVTATQLLAQVETLLSDVARYDQRLAGFAETVAELRIAIENLGGDLRSYLGSLDMDPARLVALEERAEVIKSLSRKYGKTVNEILAKREQLAEELAVLENYEVSLERAESAYQRALAELESAAARLSAARQEAARRFEKLVQKEMQGLSLPGARFFVSVRPRSEESSTSGRQDDNVAQVNEVQTYGKSGGSSAQPRLLPQRFGPHGVDEVEYLVVLNPGDEPRPLRKVASGGELSRIMLAIESVLAERDRVPTLIFDEIDTGISGHAAERVGEKLRQLGQNRQVLCVTHLPQIAACGHRQLVVEKFTQNDKTFVKVAEVAGEQRELALAQMLSGRAKDTESRQFARRLLERFSPLAE